jgi:hypothetical protein
MVVAGGVMWLKRSRFWLLFGWNSVHISAGAPFILRIPWTSSVPASKCRGVLQMRPQLLPSPSFPIHHSVIISPFNASVWDIVQIKLTEKQFDPSTNLYFDPITCIVIGCSCVQLSTKSWRRMEEWMYKFTFSWPRHLNEASGSFTLRPIYPRYPLGRRLGRPQNRSGQRGQGNLAFNGTRISDPSAVQPIANRHTDCASSAPHY